MVKRSAVQSFPGIRVGGTNPKRQSATSPSRISKRMPVLPIEAEDAQPISAWNVRRASDLVSATFPEAIRLVSGDQGETSHPPY
jgi:hypothetical protein